MTLLLLLLLMMMMKHSEPLLVYRAGAPWFLIRGLGGGGGVGRGGVSALLDRSHEVVNMCVLVSKELGYSVLNISCQASLSSSYGPHSCPFWPAPFFFFLAPWQSKSQQSINTQGVGRSSSSRS